METLFFISVLHRQQNSTQFKNHEHTTKIVALAGGYIRAMFENAGREREMILKCEEKCGKYEDTYPDTFDTNSSTSS